MVDESQTTTSFNEAAYGSIELVLMVKAMPCYVCRNASLESDAAHVTKTRGAGASYEDIAPLCRAHHQELHAIGVSSFQKKYGISLSNAVEQTRLALETLRIPPYGAE